MITARIVVHVVIVCAIATNDSILIDTTNAAIDTIMIAMLAIDTMIATSAKPMMIMTKRITGVIAIMITRIARTIDTIAIEKMTATINWMWYQESPSCHAC